MKSVFRARLVENQMSGHLSGIKVRPQEGGKFLAMGVTRATDGESN